MTETSCLIAGSQRGDNTSGHVGAPKPSCGKDSCRFGLINAGCSKDVTYHDCGLVLN